MKAVHEVERVEGDDDNDDNNNNFIMTMMMMIIMMMTMMAMVIMMILSWNLSSLSSSSQGALVGVLQEANQEVPQDIYKYPMLTKKKQSKVCAHYVDRCVCCLNSYYILCLCDFSCMVTSVRRRTWLARKRPR